MLTYSDRDASLSVSVERLGLDPASGPSRDRWEVIVRHLPSDATLYQSILTLR